MSQFTEDQRKSLSSIHNEGIEDWNKITPTLIQLRQAQMLTIEAALESRNRTADLNARLRAKCSSLLDHIEALELQLEGKIASTRKAGKK